MDFYRFWDIPTDGGGVMVQEELFTLVKETACGHWIRSKEDFISSLGDQLRWVSKTSRKRYAYPSREEAITSFIARKRQQIRYMRIKLRRAEMAFEKGIQIQNRMLEKAAKDLHS